MKVWETVTAKNLVYQYQYIDYDKPTTQSKVLIVEKTGYQASLYYIHSFPEILKLF